MYGHIEARRYFERFIDPTTVIDFKVSVPK